ncbi:hypothetical protein QQ045_015907 [Rhodiola kirilowii]
MPTPTPEVKKKVQEARARRKISAYIAERQEDSIADGEVSGAQFTTIRSEVPEISSGKLVRFTRIASNTGESVDPEKVPVTKETGEGNFSGVRPDNYREDQNVSVINDEEDEEEEEEPGEASIGKKLWTFFTS